MNGTKHVHRSSGLHDSGRSVVGERCTIRYKPYRNEPWRGVQVIMPERVTIKQVRILFAESLRFPGEGKSAQG